MCSLYVACVYDCMVEFIQCITSALYSLVLIVSLHYVADGSVSCSYNGVHVEFTIQYILYIYPYTHCMYMPIVRE